MIFIGDIHGQWGYYTELIKNITHTPTIQVGDFGIGFAGNTYHPKSDGEHWFIRGNHDNPTEVRKCETYLGDYGFRKEWNLFFVGGADSIDKQLRVEGRNWWRDEELDYKTLKTKVLPLYEEARPKIMVTHTCPSSIRKVVLDGIDNGWDDPGDSVTEIALQAMFEIHQPDVWLFGHFHRHIDVRVNGTRFICLNTYQALEVEI